MKKPQTPLSILVGIDGSQAAVNAAKWAAVEAGSRDLPLRLVHVIEESAVDTSATGPDLGVEYAETVLRQADMALHADTESVKVETAMVRGSPGSSLIGESRNAAMVCVGSVGIGRYGRLLLGSTADALARGAHCPVAIIRMHGETSEATPGAIAVPVVDSPDNDIVLEHAFREAHLRAAPILALEARPWRDIHLPDQRIEHWASRNPDVNVRLTLVQRVPTDFLTGADDPIQLAVIGNADIDAVPRIVGPVNHRLPHRAGCSVLVVRS